MSYILDALKKAEADRDPDTRTRLAFEQRERRRGRFITYAVLTALIANAVLLLWLFLPPMLEDVAPSQVVPTGTEPIRALMAPEAALESAPVSTAAPVAATPPAVPVRSDPPLPPAPPPRETRLETPGETVIGPGSVAVSSEPTTRLTSLPDAARGRFPALSFSTHVYADEPGLRAVVVNGRRLSEGDRLGELTLEEITEDGAVFRFEGRRVEVGVLDGWN